MQEIKVLGRSLLFSCFRILRSSLFFFAPFLPWRYNSFKKCSLISGALVTLLFARPPSAVDDCRYGQCPILTFLEFVFENFEFCFMCLRRPKLLPAAGFADLSALRSLDPFNNEIRKHFTFRLCGSSPSRQQELELDSARG